jgi:hypothetical protein
VHCTRTPNTVAKERQRVGEREKGSEGNKIGNSGYRVWDRDNTGAEDINRKQRISITKIEYFFLEMKIEMDECG